MNIKGIKLKRLKAIQYTSVGFLITVGIVNYLDCSAISIANSTISADLNLNASEMRLLLSAFSLSYAIAQLPVGGLLDRFGSRLILGVSMFVWSLAQFVGGGSPPSFPLLQKSLVNGLILRNVAHQQIFLWSHQQLGLL